MDGVPLLLATPEHERPPFPTVLWFHGLRVEKETHRAELERLAQHGFLAVGVDNAGHGARRMPDLEARFDPPRDEIEPLLISLVEQTAREVPSIFDSLIKQGLADPQRLGCAGVSMGGYIVYGSITADERIRAAVALQGSPCWQYGKSPDRELDRFFPTAILSITAEKDESVPPQEARSLHEKLQPLYQTAPERLDYQELDGASHLLTAEQWQTAIDATCEWFVMHLLV